MKKKTLKSKSGLMIKYISTEKEREEARKRLFEALDKVYSKHQKISY